ncbi:ThuA domain-containing protein [Streptomyces sp. NBC_01474]|nr:ThuA domain-containing protein [Streptomyces sp. NBC_01474]
MAGRAALRELGEEHGFKVETSENPAVFTDAFLAGRSGGQGWHGYRHRALSGALVHDDWAR